MNRYALLIHAGASAHAPDATPDDTLACDEHAGRLRSHDAMLAAYAFTPRDLAVSVRTDGAVPGPFLGDASVVVGVHLIEAPDLDAAVAIAGTNPVVAQGGGVEVRPLHSGGAVDRGGRPRAH